MFGKKTPSEEELREELTETIREEVREELKEEVEEKMLNEAYNKGYFFGYDDAKTKYEAVDRVKRKAEKEVAEDHNMQDRPLTDAEHYVQPSSKDIEWLRDKNMGPTCTICSEFLIENKCPNAHNHRKYTKNKHD